MTYTQIALSGVIIAVLLDLFGFKTKLVTRKVFWVSYAIIIFFQLITNGILTGYKIVRYNGDMIIGKSTPLDGKPPLIGSGRLIYAPIEDLMFGFALVLLSLTLWVWLGRNGVQREPEAGPPRGLKNQ
ncbi:MAG: lycopene cyclase domain-containing protein [Actinobacteria bacterium]|nr:lycopene cyclase domain-containing protein [Actinomycetota bacterium]